MTWLETTVGHAPPASAIALARRDERAARAVLVTHNDAEVVATVAASARGAAARSAQRMRQNRQVSGRFVRELAGNPWSAPATLAALCTHPRATVRLAAWANPSTPTDAVIAALGTGDDEVFALRGTEAHSALATRAAAVVWAHPETTAVLSRHGHGAVRSGAVALGVLDAHIVAGLPDSTRRTSGLLTNPTYESADSSVARVRLDALLDGRTCREAVAAMDVHEAREAARIGAPHLDMALAVRFPRVLLEETTHLGAFAERAHLSPVALAAACMTDKDGWMLALAGQSVARINLTRWLSPQIDSAVAGEWYRASMGPGSMNRALHHEGIASAVARVLGDDPSVWELWGRLTAGVALDDVDTALERARAAAGALAPRQMRGG